ncbi:hypothetical protein KCP73_12055 [Salmonella enterica subsp. enterica]|nr:hypothetical protein KCP73_12055 [Salmonella enterica subsp. enterica]
MKSNHCLTIPTKVALLKEPTEGPIEDERSATAWILHDLQLENDLKTPAQAAMGAKGERDRIFGSLLRALRRLG